MNVTLIFEDDSLLTRPDYLTMSMQHAEDNLRILVRTGIKRIVEKENNILIVYYDSMLGGARITFITHTDRYEEGYKNGRIAFANELTHNPAWLEMKRILKV